MRLKWISGLFICLGLALLMSHNTNAASTRVNVSSFNGWYGYKVGNNNPGRNQNLTGSLPLDALSGVQGVNKDLYGVGNRFSFSLTTGSRYNVDVNFMLAQQHIDSYYLDLYQQYKTATWTFDDNSTSTLNCTTRVEYNNQTDGYFVVFSCPYSGAKKPVSASATLGRTQSFTVGSDSPIMSTQATQYSVRVYSAWYNYEVITNDQQGVIDELGNIDNTLNDQFDKENQAVDNIENQQPPASGSGQNSTTSSLLDTLGSFLTAITNLSATNCEVVLAFPAFAGGSQTVNICQNKEYTGNVVSVAGSIILVLFYLPVAFMLINKIYSEIRSFTNG